MAKKKKNLIVRDPWKEAKENAQQQFLQTSAWRNCGGARQQLLMPENTPNLLCNWSPVHDGRLSIVMDVCGELWSSCARKSSVDCPPSSLLCDLGCGDGRVVLQVCSAFPSLRGCGVDLNAGLVEEANRNAKQQGLDGRCHFKVSDMAQVDLSEVTIVFLNLPANCLHILTKRIFSKAGLRPGAIVMSADGPLPDSRNLEPLRMRNTRIAKERWGFYGYLWKDEKPEEKGIEMPRSESPLESILHSQIARNNVEIRRPTLVFRTPLPLSLKKPLARDHDEQDHIDNEKNELRHAAVAQCLGEVYKHVNGAYSVECLDTQQDSGNLPTKAYNLPRALLKTGADVSGELTSEGLAVLYSAMQIRPEDVFCGVGTGIAKLVLYVALRGQVAHSSGIEVTKTRYPIAEKACERLTRELEETDLTPPCSKFSVALWDSRGNSYNDATVICSSVTPRMLGNFMKSTTVRRLATISQMPPNTRLRLVTTVKVPCTWGRMSIWHIYDLLPLRIRTSSPVAAAAATWTKPQLMSSESLPALTQASPQGSPHFGNFDKTR